MYTSKFQLKQNSVLSLASLEIGTFGVVVGGIDGHIPIAQEDIDSVVYRSNKYEYIEIHPEIKVWGDNLEAYQVRPLNNVSLEIKET